MLADAVEATQVSLNVDLALSSAVRSVDPVLSAIEAYRFARTQYDKAAKMLAVLV
jgi:hypothetical protein